jgi:hypothetical protein
MAASSAEKSRAWRERNPGMSQLGVTKAEYNTSPAHREQNARWRYANPDRIFEANQRAYAAANQARWAEMEAMNG